MNEGSVVEALHRTAARSPVDQRLDGLLEATLESLGLPVAMLDRTGLVTWVNTAWREAAPYAGRTPASCAPGDNYLEFCEAAGRDDGAALVVRGFNRVFAGRQRLFERTWSLSDGGSRRDFRIRISRLDGRATPTFLVSNEEITALSQARNALSEVTDRLLEVQAEERQRLAVELHDSVGQHLVAIGLSLSRLRIVASDTDGISTIISDMASSLHEAHAQIRSLSYLLNPPWPEREGGLEDAVREFVHGFGGRAGLRVEVRLKGAPIRVDRGRQLTLFRILQEAVVNVYRHAHADVVTVELANLGPSVRLRITDDGCGFLGPDGAGSQLGVGLPGMRGRVSQYGGDLRITTGPSGTTVTVTLPTTRAGGIARLMPEPRSSRTYASAKPADRAPQEPRSWDPGRASSRRRPPES